MNEAVDPLSSSPGSPDSNSVQEQALSSYFLASVTHEFRTPLASLNASVEYMLDEFDQLSPDEIRELLKTIHLSVTGLQTLIDNLLESITIEAGRFVIRLQEFELEGVIDDVIHIVSPLLVRRRQRLLVKGPRQLPTIMGDPTRLTQVLVNLISNASKYGPMDQSIELLLECLDESLSPNPVIRVSVIDEGPGVPRSEQAKLFQRFTRIQMADGTQFGVGLGLSVVKAIIQEHGGQVGMEERPGGGSIFWFTVPVSEASA